MDIVTLYEIASTDGYMTTGHGIYYRDSAVAKQVAWNKHAACATEPLQHVAIEVEDGRYLLLKPPVIPITVADTAQAVGDIAKAALAKLSPVERAALGITNEEVA